MTLLSPVAVAGLSFAVLLLVLAHYRANLGGRAMFAFLFAAAAYGCVRSLSIRALKESTLKTLDLPYGEALKYAHAVLDKLMESRDAREGMRAFVEKRAPVWEAR